MALIVLLSVSMFVQGFFYGSVLIRQAKNNKSNVVTTFFSAVAAFQSITSIIPQMMVLEKGKVAGSTLREIMAQVLQGSSDRRESGHWLPDPRAATAASMSRM
jgi:ATP-binding cassette, subfamily B (MDR/TAP), member 1